MEATGRCLLLGRNESFTTNSQNSIQNKQKRETTGKCVPGVTGTPILQASSETTSPWEDANQPRDGLFTAYLLTLSQG